MHTLRNVLGQMSLYCNTKGLRKGELMPTVNIDGCKVEVEKNATILDAAEKAGIWIPTLCYHPAISKSASCRLCMVELDRGDWKQLVTACNYPVRRDVVVYAYSERAQETRRGVMELLLARSPESEELKVLAERMGIKGTPYPKVTESQRNCILCGLCVQVCEEIIGKAAIGFAGRGVDRIVAAPFRQPSEDCIGCGVCAAVCPVGTIKVRIHHDTQEVEISPFKSRAKLLICRQCGASTVSQDVGEYVLKSVNIDSDELRKWLQLCPRCRRQQSVERFAAATVSKRE